jgi:hypothetical protein
MKKIIIKNSHDVQTNGAHFDDDDKMNAWLDEGKINNWWGLPERWVKEGQEDISIALETRVVIDSPEQVVKKEILPEIPWEPIEGEEPPPPVFEDVIIPEVSHVEYKLAATFSIEIIDITEETIAYGKILKAKKALEKGKDIVAFVWALNDGREISIEDTILLAQDQQAFIIQTLLHNGAIATAKQMIENYSGVWFTSDDKIKILNFIGE